MNRSSVERILDAWDETANAAAMPVVAPRPGRRGRNSFSSLVPLLAAGLIVAIGVAWVDGRISDLAGGPDTSTSPTPLLTPSAGASSASPSVSPSVEPSPTLNPCVRLAAPLAWEGAAGHRIANITLSNRSDVDCIIGEFERVQYVDGVNSVLIEGPASPGSLTIPAHSSVSTLVEIGNFCGPTPRQPVGFIFLKPGGGILLVGSDQSQADMSVPPCISSNAAATIQMQPWAR